MLFHEKIKKFREEKGYTQQQLADKLYVSRQTVCRWESGSRCPDLVMAKKLAMELDVGLDELISDSVKENMGMENVMTDYYGLWTTEKIKDRKKWRELQKRILAFIEIVGSFFIGIQVLLVGYFGMRMPLWGTVAVGCVLVGAVAFERIVSRKLYFSAGCPFSRIIFGSKIRFWN